MTFDTNLLPVTIVSTDTNVLRELSWTLSTFGYQVLSSSDWSDEAAWQRSSRATLQLLDARGSNQAQAVLSAARSGAFCYRIALHDAADGEAANELLAAGADDLIRYPACTGELLSRLRAGVRRMEFERRLAAMTTRDAATGLATRRGLTGHLDRLTADGWPGGEAALVVCGIDFLDLIREEYGHRAVRRLAATLASCVKNCAGRDNMVALLSEGVLVAVLPRQSVREAAEFAESIARDFGGRDTLVREIRSLPSLSAAVLEWNDGASPEEMLARAVATLENVRSYGGNVTLMASDVEREIADWQRQMASGTLFQTVVAQDVMEAFPLVLPLDRRDWSDLLEKFEVDRSQRRRPPCIPVVDEQGLLVDVVDPEKPFADLAEAIWESTELATVGHNEPLGEVLETFAASDASHLVVTDEGRPVGYLGREALAALFVDPVGATTYREEIGDRSSLASLVVPLEPVQPDDVRAGERALAEA